MGTLVEHASGIPRYRAHQPSVPAAQLNRGWIRVPIPADHPKADLTVGGTVKADVEDRESALENLPGAERADPAVDHIAGLLLEEQLRGHLMHGCCPRRAPVDRS